MGTIIIRSVFIHPTSFMISKHSQRVMASSDAITPHSQLRRKVNLSAHSHFNSHTPWSPPCLTSALHLTCLIVTLCHHSLALGYSPISTVLASTMPRRGQRQRGRSRRGGVVEHITRATIAPTVEAYEAHTPSHIRAELDLAEVDARVLRRFIDHAAVDVEIGQWIPYLGSYRERATLYTRTVDLYWLLKMMMGKVLVEHNEAHEENFYNWMKCKWSFLQINRKVDRLLSVNMDGVGPSH
jgi:hypothetical protein